MQTKLLINGKLVEGKGEALRVLDPASGKTLVRSMKRLRAAGQGCSHGSGCGL